MRRRMGADQGQSIAGPSAPAGQAPPPSPPPAAASPPVGPPPAVHPPPNASPGLQAGPPPQAAAHPSTNGTGQRASVSVDPREAGEEVTATWGEELFTPAPYNAYRVGPFSYTTRVRPGESVSDALVRAQTVVTGVAEKERTRKHASYLASLVGVVSDPRAVAARQQMGRN